MRWGIGLCVAGSQGKQVRVSLGEAWVITVQKEQTRQSREVGGTGDGSEGMFSDVNVSIELDFL